MRNVGSIKMNMVIRTMQRELCSPALNLTLNKVRLLIWSVKCWKQGVSLSCIKFPVSVKQSPTNFTLGEGNGNPLQCSCLENPRDGGALRAAVYGVAQSRTRLKRLSSSSSKFTLLWWPVATCAKSFLQPGCLVTTLSRGPLVSHNDEAT